jgi:hypothetical protein
VAFGGWLDSHVAIASDGVSDDLVSVDEFFARHGVDGVFRDPIYGSINLKSARGSARRARPPHPRR